MGKLDGKVAVVTGGGSGIGLAVTRRFIADGAQVFIAGRSEAKLKQAAADLGGRVIPVRADVADLGDLDMLYEQVREQAGVLDIVVTSAGFLQLQTLADATPEHFDTTFAVNVRGTFFTVQKALPLLRNGGAVVLIGSSGHLVGIPPYTTYSASKAAMRSFARSWAAELKDIGVRVNIISPGPVDTTLIDGQASGPEEAAQLREMMTALVPLGRLGRPEEIADAASFLASDEASFITGTDLLVDGGQIAL